ncbi:unnamed protein product [Phaedon cochleariae]|uniref:BPTI/Kunitz inhibitor domain-containing protein n=1 Tax=Phaedon cochleariae TaxID=80249 RepID=A0A9P0GXG0_PHACE|nr:unnamed protein product [Phaedon cochleariae]
MKVFCGVFLVVLAVTNSVALEQAAQFFTEAESPESLAARSFQPGDCQKDTHEGTFVCMALFWRYRWNDKHQGCVKAVFGGCHETKNNFKTKEECEKVAVPICKAQLNR